MKKTSIKNNLIAIFITIFASFYLASPVMAQTVEWTGEGNVCTGGADNDVATIQGLECLIANVFMVIITLIGLAAFVMFIVGSIQWLLAGSSADGTKKAKDTFTYAVIGIVVALSAFIALNLIAGFTGVEAIKQFIIPASNS